MNKEFEITQHKVDNELEPRRNRHGRQPHQKLKSYLVLQILLRETDENHTLKAPEIAAKLELMGIEAERRSLYRDIDEINLVLYMLENGLTVEEAEEASVNNRVFHNNGCPYCSGRQPIKGQNDLATTNPELLLEWDFEKNSVSPFEVKAKSNKVIWWRCNLNHPYQSPICNRTSGRGCPYCSNHRVLKGFNDLLTTNPDSGYRF